MKIEHALLILLFFITAGCGVIDNRPPSTDISSVGNDNTVYEKLYCDYRELVVTEIKRAPFGSHPRN